MTKQCPFRRFKTKYVKWILLVALAWIPIYVIYTHIQVTSDVLLSGGKLIRNQRYTCVLVSLQAVFVRSVYPFRKTPPVTLQVQIISLNVKCHRFIIIRTSFRLSHQLNY